MGEVVKLFDNDDGLEALENLKAMIEQGQVTSFIVCATLKDNAVASVIHRADIDLYAILGLMEAVKSELVTLHERR